MNKKKEIIFFLSQAISSRNLNRLGYFELKKHFNVKFIDLTLLFNVKNENRKFIRNSKTLFKVNSWDELKKKIGKKIFFIDLTTYNSLNFILLQKYLIKNGSIKIHITPATLPTKPFLNASFDNSVSLPTNVFVRPLFRSNAFRG